MNIDDLLRTGNDILEDVMQAVNTVASAQSFLSCSQRRAEKAHPPFPPQPGAH